MANTLFAPKVFSNFTIQKLDRENVFVAHTNRAYEWDIKKAWDSVRVQTLPTLTFTANSITGAGNMTTAEIGTGPGWPITASDFAIVLETLIIDKYTEKLVRLTKHEIIQSNLSLEEKVAERFAEGLGTMYDDEIVKQILVTQVANIPAENKINSASPVALTATNVYAEIMKLRSALKKKNVKVKNMRLFVSTDVETVLLQSDFVKGSDAWVGIMKTWYIGTVWGVQIYSTTALDASNEMIMMAEGAVNFVTQLVDTDSANWVDGSYMNVWSTATWWMKIFAENAKAIAINYVASVA